MGYISVLFLLTYLLTFCQFFVWNVFSSNCVLCVWQGVHLDEYSAAMHHCTCSDTDPVCPRCGGTRQSRDPVDVTSEGVASMGVVMAGARRDHVTTSVGDVDVSEAVPVAGAVADESDDKAEKDVIHCIQRLHSSSELTATHPHHRQHQQQRSFSVLHDLPTDVGGVSARSAPDSAVPLRQPEVGQTQEGQRSRIQRFFEPLKRSRSTGNHKEAITAAQALLSDPTRYQAPVC